MRFPSFFHVGIRVRDIARAMDEIGRSMGVTWASVEDDVTAVWRPETGPVEYRRLVTYSVEGPVHLELLQSPPGSIWNGDDAPGAHHFGFWSDDVKADTEALLAEGWRLELAANAPANGYGRFTYVCAPNGFRVEPVSSAIRYRFERWWSGGPLKDPPAPS